MLFVSIIFALLPVMFALMFSAKAATYTIAVLGGIAGFTLSFFLGLILAFMTGYAPELRTFEMTTTMTSTFVESITADSLYKMLVVPYIFVADIFLLAMKINYHLKSFLLVFPQVAFLVVYVNFIRSIEVS